MELIQKILTFSIGLNILMSSLFVVLRNEYDGFNSYKEKYSVIKIIESK